MPSSRANLRFEERELKAGRLSACEVIDLLTRESGETYTDYLGRICTAGCLA